MNLPVTTYSRPYISFSKNTAKDIPCAQRSTKDLKFLLKQKNIINPEENCKRNKNNFNKNCDFYIVRLSVSTGIVLKPTLCLGYVKVPVCKFLNSNNII